MAGYNVENGINLKSDLHPIFYDQVKKLLSEFSKQNINYTITSAFRTYSTQYQRRYVDKDYTFAPPSKSYHVKRRAVDIVFKTDSGKTKALEIGKALGFFVKRYDTKPHLHFDDRYTKYKLFDKSNKHYNTFKTAGYVFLGLLGGTAVFLEREKIKTVFQYRILGRTKKIVNQSGLGSIGLKQILQNVLVSNITSVLGNDKLHINEGEN